MSVVKIKKKTEPRITVSFRLPLSKSRKVKIRAAEIGISKSMFVERAIDLAFRSATARPVGRQDQL